MADAMPHYHWQMQRGGEILELQKVPLRVLAMISGGGGCERKWSAYDFVHLKKRNRLAPKRAIDFVDVFTNTRLRQRSSRLLKGAWD